MKYSLIGINEGIEELTLTLLIGIKADLLQFILYPDKQWCSLRDTQVYAVYPLGKVKDLRIPT